MKNDRGVLCHSYILKSFRVGVYTKTFQFTLVQSLTFYIMASTYRKAVIGEKSIPINKICAISAVYENHS